MSNVFIENAGNLSGLGEAPRREISYEEWVQQTNQQWVAANPSKVAGYMAPTIGGIAALSLGALAYFMGSTKLGLGLGVVGLGAVVYGQVKTATDFGGKSILNVEQSSIAPDREGKNWVLGTQAKLDDRLRNLSTMDRAVAGLGGCVECQAGY